MIIALVEHERGRLNELSLEMLTLGRQLAGTLSTPLHAALIGEEAEPLAERLGPFGVSLVYGVRHALLGAYAPEAWARCLAQLVESLRPAIVMAAGSERGHEVMAYLAAMTDLPLAANCVAVQPGEPFRVTRLRWGGSLLEEAEVQGTSKLLSVAPHAIPAEMGVSPGAPELQLITPVLSPKDVRARVARRVESGAGRVSLAEARVVVGGGRGVGGADGFRALEELAGLLDGAVGGSRVATSLGWRPHADQVGQTGTRIAPELYIACGISGAIQHMVGCKSAKHILAINSDREAPIIARADYAIIGDLHQVVPAISAAIQQARQDKRAPASDADRNAG